MLPKVLNPPEICIPCPEECKRTVVEEVRARLRAAGDAPDAGRLQVLTARVGAELEASGLALPVGIVA